MSRTSAFVRYRVMLIARATFVFALLSVGSSSAQTLRGPSGPPSSGGITVSGRGVASAVPDRARVSVSIFGAVGAPGQNGASTTSVPLDDAARAVADAVRASGLSDARVLLPIGNLTTRNITPQLIFTVAKPTRERLEAIARQIVAAVPGKYAAALSNTQIALVLMADDCSADEARAERAAFADARARAGRLAAAAGLRLGAVTNVADTLTFLPPGCATKPDESETNGVPFGPQAPNPYGPLVLPITVNVTVTFAIGDQTR